jgi:hypothetical protein
MSIIRRRKAAARWPLITAMTLAAAAAFFAWAFLVREKEAALTDEELREVEAFEEYERRKVSGV